MATNVPPASTSNEHSGEPTTPRSKENTEAAHVPSVRRISGTGMEGRVKVIVIWNRLGSAIEQMMALFEMRASDDAAARDTFLRSSVSSAAVSPSISASDTFHSTMQIPTIAPTARPN